MSCRCRAVFGCILLVVALTHFDWHFISCSHTGQLDTKCRVVVVFVVVIVIGLICHSKTFFLLETRRRLWISSVACLVVM